MLAIGLASDEELHPDFHDPSGGVELVKKDFPATGESGPKVGRPDGVDRFESENASNSGSGATPAQPLLLTWNHGK